MPVGGTTGNDAVELRVAKNGTAGAIQVQFRDIDFQANGGLGLVTTLQNINLSLGPPLNVGVPAGEQIVLRLTHAADSNAISASFDILAADGITVQTLSFASTGIFGVQGSIFSDETWTQAQIHASSPATDNSYLTTSYGTLSVDSSGAYSYGLLNGTNGTNLPVQQLAAGQTVADNFTIQVTDDQGASATTGATINVTGINDRPVVDLNDSSAGTGTTLGYAENDTATRIATSATVTDVDSVNAPDFIGGSLTVSFDASGTSADQLSIRNQGTGAGQIGISGSDVTFGGSVIGTFSGGVNGANLIITFNSSLATPAAVQSLVRNIQYFNNSESPSTSPRTVTFSLNDGDGIANGGTNIGTATATINVSNFNDAPVFSPLTNNITFTENGAALALSPTLTVSDPDNPANFNGGQIIVNLAGTHPGDQLLLMSGGSVTLSGSDVQVGGTTIGSISAGGLAGGFTSVTINLNSNATAANVNAVVQALAFRSTSDDPNEGAPVANRGATITFSDGGNTGGQISSNANATVQIVVNPVNDAPALANVAASAAYTENAAGTVLSSGLTVSDAENANLTLATVKIANGFVAGDVLDANVAGTSITKSYNSATGVLTLTGSDTKAHYQQALDSVTFSSTSDNPTNAGANATRTIDWQVSDGSGERGLPECGLAQRRAGSPGFCYHRRPRRRRRQRHRGGEYQRQHRQGVSGRRSRLVQRSGAILRWRTRPQSVALADFNGDGKLDVVTANSDGGDVTVASRCRQRHLRSGRALRDGRPREVGRGR